MACREFPKNVRETVRVTPYTFKGYDLVDVRIYVENPEKEVVATKKGISLNVDMIPELIASLQWALGQPCEDDPATNEEPVPDPSKLDVLAEGAWTALRAHGSAVHWDTAERLVLAGALKKFSKWHLHYVLAARTDLFERLNYNCYKATSRG